MCIWDVRAVRVCVCVRIRMCVWGVSGFLHSVGCRGTGHVCDDVNIQCGMCEVMCHHVRTHMHICGAHARAGWSM